jgi:hypothetical protein
MTSAPMGVRHRDWVCDNHQARGVAISNSRPEVSVASWRVKVIACQACGVRVLFIAESGDCA